MACHACRVYEERPALVPELGGALVWHVEAVGSRRVLPDGCMDLIWADGTLLVAGADTGPVVLDTGPRMRPFTGVRFAPGDGPDVLGVPAHELTDRRVPLAALWPQRRVRELTERVAAAADPGLFVLRVSLGRYGDDAPLGWDDQDLVRAALHDLHEASGLPGRPVDSLVTRWYNGLPQYAVGHAARVERIRRYLSALPGLRLAGAAYDGVGIPACVASGRRAARELLMTLPPGPAPETEAPAGS